MTRKSFNDTFLKACRGESVPYTPVWYMRQAGRYQPEYREIRQRHTFFEMNEKPEVCAEVTRLPVEQLGVDAAILFADIMTPLKPVGVDVQIKSGVGPVISNPVRTPADVNRIGSLSPQRDVPFVLESIHMLTSEQLDVPLIGFAGAPFTLASYLIEGGPSKNYHQTKGFMYSQPEAWEALMEKLADLTVTYLTAQISAGAHAVQVFDSWVGALNAADYQTYVAPVMHRIFPVERIHRCSPHLFWHRSRSSPAGMESSSGGCDRSGLANIHPGSTTAGNREKPPGKSGSIPVVGPLGADRKRGPGDSGSGNGNPGTHIQPRSWNLP